jgi:hypothetical protein
MIYQIVFNSGETYDGGNSLFETKWKEIPKDKKIRTIIYFIPTGAGLVLSEFRKIYHYVEGVEDLNGAESGKIRIEFSYLIIERDDKYIQYQINQSNANVIVNIFKKDSEYIKKLNPDFWRN